PRAIRGGSDFTLSPVVILARQVLTRVANEGIDHRSKRLLIHLTSLYRSATSSVDPSDQLVCVCSQEQPHGQPQTAGSRLYSLHVALEGCTPLLDRTDPYLGGRGARVPTQPVHAAAERCLRAGPGGAPVSG